MSILALKSRDRSPLAIMLEHHAEDLLAWLRINYPPSGPSPIDEFRARLDAIEAKIANGDFNMIPAGGIPATDTVGPTKPQTEQDIGGIVPIGTKL
jgi:hypothetical protein